MLFNQSRLIVLNVTFCLNVQTINSRYPTKEKPVIQTNGIFWLILSIQLSTDYCSQMGIIPRCVTLAVKRYTKCRSTGSPALLAIVHTVGKKHIV